MKRFWLIFLPIVLVLSILFDFVFKTFDSGHGEMWWVNFHLFYVSLGFIGCVAMVYIAKWIAKHWLGRGEDYYD